MSYPGEAPAVWQGVYGGAVVVKDGDCYAITSDGRKHKL